VSGGAITVAGLLYGHYAPTSNIPDWLFWSIGGLGLLAACFFAWRDEHRASAKAEDHVPSINYEALEKLAKQGAEIADLKAQLAPRSLSCEKSDKLFRFLRNQHHRTLYGSVTLSRLVMAQVSPLSFRRFLNAPAGTLRLAT
jgi:hypothetical protein